MRIFDFNFVGTPSKTLRINFLDWAMKGRGKIEGTIHLKTLLVKVLLKLSWCRAWIEKCEALKSLLVEQTEGTQRRIFAIIANE